MSEEDFKLPGASLEELEKIIESYYHQSGPASNDEVATLAGVSSDTVSRCNGFLVNIGLIESGKQKKSTELGNNLGRALEHRESDDIRRYWQEAVSGNSFLSSILTMVRVQRGIGTEELPDKVLYKSGAKKHSKTEAGAKAVVDVLSERAKLLVEENGTYVIAKDRPLTKTNPTTEEEVQVEPPDAATGGDVSDHTEDTVGKPLQRHVQARAAERAGFSLAINLQLQLPEFEDTKKYDDLFRSLRKHLLNPPENDQS